MCGQMEIRVELDGAAIDAYIRKRTNGAVYLAGVSPLDWPLAADVPEAER
jgi:hypothetical protein